MRGADVLEVLSARITDSSSGIAYVTEAELEGWPSALVAAFKANGLLIAASPSRSATCDGCERLCIMAVEIIDYGGSKDAFIFCDKRDDIDRIEVSLKRLRRWESSGEAVAALLTRMLTLRQPEPLPAAERAWPVGMMKKGSRAGPLVLSALQHGLVLSLGGHVLALAEVLVWRRGTLELQRQRLLDCVDKPVLGAGGIETSAQRRERMMNRRDALQASGQRNFMKILAKEEGFGDQSRETAPLSQKGTTNTAELKEPGETACRTSPRLVFLDRRVRKHSRSDERGEQHPAASRCEAEDRAIAVDDLRQGTARRVSRAGKDR